MEVEKEEQQGETKEQFYQYDSYKDTQNKGESNTQENTKEKTNEKTNENKDIDEGNKNINNLLPENQEKKQIIKVIEDLFAINKIKHKRKKKNSKLSSDNIINKVKTKSLKAYKNCLINLYKNQEKIHDCRTYGKKRNDEKKNNKKRNDKKKNNKKKNSNKKSINKNISWKKLCKMKMIDIFQLQEYSKNIIEYIEQMKKNDILNKLLNITLNELITYVFFEEKLSKEKVNYLKNFNKVDFIKTIEDRKGSQQKPDPLQDISFDGSQMDNENDHQNENEEILNQINNIETNKNNNNSLNEEMIIEDNNISQNSTQQATNFLTYIKTTKEVMKKLLK